MLSDSWINSVGFIGIIFIILKLTGAIDWSWWWITIPFWGVFAIGIVLVLIIFMVGLVFSILKTFRK